MNTLHGWIIGTDGMRRSQTLFACAACKQRWTHDAEDFPNFCPFCRATHIERNATPAFEVTP
jgi:hypothetical protein